MERIQRKIAVPAHISRNVAKTRRRLRSFGIEVFINSELLNPSKHLLYTNGKMLRPMLVFAGAEAISEDPDKFIGLAAAVELLHTSSLMHDDIIDKDEKRRGVAAVHLKYGREAAIIAGDALISKAVQESSKYGMDVIDSVSKTAMNMCAGEMLDYSYQKRRAIPNMDAYLKIAYLKSSALLGAAVSIAAVHKGDEKKARQLYEFGKNLGIAFQIRDDVTNALKLDKNSRGQGNDLKRFRPNVIKTLMEHNGISKQAATREATALNRFYIDKAKSSINGMKNESRLVEYADMVMLDHK